MSCRTPNAGRYKRLANGSWRFRQNSSGGLRNAREPVLPMGGSISCESSFCVLPRNNSRTNDGLRSELQVIVAEFGVYKGRTFAAACFLGRERRLTMRFWAFDSFAGLPDSEGEFRKGQFECGREEFLRTVRRCVGHIADVHVVPGWFSDTLSPENHSISALKAVAIAWIDCDLYESTKPVLEFLTERLSNGSVICFDDWFNIQARPDCGEQRACQEWLTRNPQLRLTPYSRFGWHGQSFDRTSRVLVI